MKPIFELMQFLIVFLSRSLILCLAFFVPLIGCASAFAGTISLNPIADASIELGHAQTNTNNGTSTSMVVDRETTDLQRALIQFDLSSIPTGATINSAVLELQATQIGGLITIEAYRIDEAWVENSVTWNNRQTGTNWSTAGGSFNPTAVASITTNSIGQHSFGITTLVQGWFGGSIANDGVMIGSPDGGGNRTITYDTREGTTPPVLVITYTLPPPTLTLSKTSVGSVGGFIFTGTNGWTSQTITTVTSNVPVTGATQTLAAAATITTITEAVPAGYAMTAASCSGLGTGGTATPNLAAGTITLNAAATVSGSTIACSITDTKIPTFKLQQITLGGFGGPFSFAQSNLASNPPAITTASETTATPASPAQINITTIGTSVTVTDTQIAGYAITAASCTDANSSITGNTGTFGTFLGTVLTLAAARVVAGADITCVITSTRPRVKIQKTTIGGSGGPFNFTTSNLATMPAAITTVAAGTPTPASPTANNVTTVGASATITETAIGTFFLSSVTCTDANSAITGNVGNIGTLAGTTLTLPAASVNAGADITCAFSNTKANPNLTILKSSSTAGPVNVGAAITYTYKVTNIGNVPMTNISINDVHNGTGVLTLPANETLTTDVAPFGDSSDTTSNNGVWSILAPGDSVTFTATYVVTQHDVDYLF
jgi:hypothetical protein